MASSKAGSSAKLPAISLDQGCCFPLAVPNSALSLATSASRAATLCSRLAAVTGIPLLNCELILARIGREIDGFYIDPAVTGKKPMFERGAGKELIAEVRPGDIVIVARLDRLARSFIDFVNILESVLRTPRCVPAHLRYPRGRLMA
jgi:Resolvase, N terminal domain